MALGCAPELNGRLPRVNELSKGNAMSENDQQALKGANILFVEDTPDSVRYYLQELRAAVGETGSVVLVRTLGEAVEAVTTGSYYAVIIDLHIPGDSFPSELEPYRSRIRGNLNQGQVLGLWLTEQQDASPYVYLSNVQEAYDNNADDSPLAIYNKYQTLPFELPGMLVDLIGNPPE